jgi:hypothetical protein
VVWRAGTFSTCTHCPSRSRCPNGGSADDVHAAVKPLELASGTIVGLYER